MPLSEEMRRALAILDGTDKPGREPPREPGFYFSPQGHSFILAAEHGPALERAEHAAIALFGTSRLCFGVAISLVDPAGGVTPWIHTAYSYHADPGKWFVPPCGDRRLLPAEMRVVEVFAVPDAATGLPGAIRSLPLSSEFAFSLLNRIQASRDSNNPAGAFLQIADQINRNAGSNIDKTAFARSEAVILPHLPAADVPTATTTTAAI